VATSLDGYIADEDGGYGWIPAEDGLDFGAFLAGIDTLVMGRGTYETWTSSPDESDPFESMTKFVFSSTLEPGPAEKGVTVVGEDAVDFVRSLKSGPGRDIWLFGGGVLFRSLLGAGLVDRVELGVVPALLGAGIPLLPGFEGVARLSLHSCETFGPGLVLLKYDVAPVGDVRD
jgi:dihydrofolate reductase